MTEATVIKFCLHVGHIKLVLLGWPPTLSGHGRLVRVMCPFEIFR